MVCKGKTSEKEAYIRRTIWSSEKKNGGLWEIKKKEYEKWLNYEGKQQKNYEKYLCVILFLIHHLSDNKQVIPKVWEYEKWIWYIRFFFKFGGNLTSRGISIPLLRGVAESRGGK